ncbi:hypothetical protein VTN77DRAFT_4254 [Rasamsonia byssochlamydoides]|uniref:uncharacterized protein n=1 Tax=Rasamsonia byssochlamydoides TaxID=89139 RepID=UPI003743A2A0
MSTFNGIVEEFPFIRIDYFRKIPDKPAPLACFLSHVHSDHLQGLESFRSPFIYCSAVTRELLLRIEKYPHRMNFTKGILESRKQHYGHLAKLLRPIPLNTPTDIELTPRQRIRVTLLDANHCAGAVMFLIEGDGKSILYTGDIRAESWWVSKLVRHPVLIPYTCGLKRLDTIYLDTTFAIKSHIYRTFPSKAEGIRELLEKVQHYSDDTIFYLRAWTFGYEDVWLALSAALNSKVHVDRYQLGLYQSLSSRSHTTSGLDDALFLCGFQLGNKFIPGCLTADEGARIHSCEPGAFCSTMVSGNAVFITPIVTRAGDGSEVPELGAGGGKGDLYQSHELQLPDESTVQQLEKLCLEQIEDSQVLSQTKEALVSAFKSKNKTLSLDQYGLKDDSDISLRELVAIISSGQKDRTEVSDGNGSAGLRDKGGRELPRTIQFPYSRHSSYSELCEFVSAFKPRDIYPCTVDPETWNEEVSMRSLFGRLCSGEDFSHDRYMREMLDQSELRPSKRVRQEGSSFMTSSQQSSISHQSMDDEHVDSVTSGSANGILPTPQAVSYSYQRNEDSVQDRIRNIRDCLEEMKDQMLFTNGPLPAYMRETRRQKGPEQSKQKQHEMDQHNNQESVMSVSLSTTDPTSQSNCNIATKSESQLSIPISLFESQNHDDNTDGSSDLYIEGAPSNDNDGNAGGNDPSLIVGPGEDTLLNKSSTSSPSSSIALKNRLRAYHAARAGTFDAWSEVSLVSAGNNHTEEEIEL